MTLSEALKSLQKMHNPDTAHFNVVLACGFSPLHLSTFLAAHLQQRMSTRSIQLKTGLFGDLAGTLEQLDAKQTQAVAVVIEWRDLDRRLNYREPGDWGPAASADIVASANAVLQRIYRALEQRSSGIRAAVSLPTIPYPPVFHTAGWQAGEAELALQGALAGFATEVARLENTAVVNDRRLEPQSLNERFDIKSDLLYGFPYSKQHADSLGSALATIIAPPAPKKGIITDLDDTFWNGLVGEVGAGNVTWDLASHQYIHGLYQQFLSAAAKRGVLGAIASKNDPAVVNEALGRSDLLISPNQIFPVEVHWEPKSGSVKRILEAWNIGADSVVFVDDSPMELAEVAGAHPGIETIRFPKNDYAGMYALLRQLSDLFGKDQVSGEDAIRLESLRAGASFRKLDEAGTHGAEDFLKQAEAVLAVDFEVNPRESRVIELVNTTNQFNLNGRRYTPGEWAEQSARSGAFTATVRYEDKFGPLGTIGVISGTALNGTAAIDVWVMSCRAFARRIEHQCVRQVFEQLNVRNLVLDFQRTPKNGPIRDFLTTVCGAAPDGSAAIDREAFERTCPPLYHTVLDTRRAEANA